MKNTVSLNKEKIKQVIANAIYSKLQARDGEISHTNRDYYFSPSRWWYDTDNEELGGYIMQTSGSIETTKDTSGQIMVNVVLKYEKLPR